MAGFRPRPGLDVVVARMVAGRVRRVADDVADTARDFAPPTKTWVTRGDADVRPEHRHADGQEVPANLRFVVESPTYDQSRYGAAPRQQLRVPRDPSATPGLTAHCRCVIVLDPDGLARRIEVQSPIVAGARVTVRVVSRGPRVVEAEYGTDGDAPARYMGRAVRVVAARRR